MFLAVVHLNHKKGLNTRNSSPRLLYEGTSWTQKVALPRKWYAQSPKALIVFMGATQWTISMGSAPS
jgi:hypothetical protein